MEGNGKKAGVLTAAEREQVAPDEPGVMRQAFNQAAVNKRLAMRVGDLTYQVDALTQALQESREREMESRGIIDELMEQLASFNNDKEEGDGDIDKQA